MLEPLGLLDVEEAAYLALVGGRSSSVEELSAELGVPTRRTQAVVDRLQDLGFVSRGPGTSTRLVAARPDLAVSALVARRSHEFIGVQRFAQQLTADFPEESRTQPEDLVEVVSGRQAVAARFAQLSRELEKEMLVLDRPPYAQVVREENRAETWALERGVAVRGIYSPEAFELPGAFERAMQSMAAGEQARVHADVPMKLVVVDDAVAMLPMTSGSAVDSALVIHAPMVVTALVKLFALLWRQACPLLDWKTDPQVGGDADAELLALLATGLKDEAIARELGVSARTLRRRVSTLLETLGARTRFQAGLQAVRRQP